MAGFVPAEKTNMISGAVREIADDSYQSILNQDLRLFAFALLPVLAKFSSFGVAG